ncbi:hypothetical protein GUJ93_ZPchr0001g32056 [Zizania palustris]|uniref:Uncharacterized protein n=1 Tax=Zizania palustris TaxID=103762 RepID=A0A8J5SD93_ZIZPA|nr:hypothetical protein GUJ93_ZPchr0001g32056 [Zizania palustris]
MEPLRTRKRGLGDGGGGGSGRDDDGAVALLGALGLGGFAGLHLHAAPDEHWIELYAAYDHASGCISVSVGGVRVSACPADLAAALELPLGPVALSPEIDASVFRSEEAIAVVRGFLRDRVLLRAEWSEQELPEEVAVALRLVEEGKAHALDWCRLFWALLKADLVTGKSRRYVPHLLRLVKCQRPELFAEVDESSPLGKRRKDMLIQPCQWTVQNSKLVESKEVKTEEIFLVGRKNRVAHGQAAEAEVEATLASGVEVDQSIGDLEEMPVFGEGREFNAVGPVYYKNSIVEAGRWVHGMEYGNAELGSQKRLCSDVQVLGCEMEGDEGKYAAGMNAKDERSPDDSSFINLLRTMDEQDDSSSLQKVISKTKPQPGPNQQRIIEIEDKDDDGNMGVVPIYPVTRNGPCNLTNYVQQRATEDIQNDQTLSSFFACTKQFKANLDNIFLDKEKAIMEAQADNHRMLNMLMAKDYTIASIKRDILEVLEERHTVICRFEHDMELMRRTFQQYRKSYVNTSAAFLEYKKKTSHGEGSGSSLEVPGIADGPNQFFRMQELYIHQRISRIQKHWLSKYPELVGYITEVSQRITHLSDQLQRLKDPMTVPDLNNGEEDGGLDNALLSKTRGGTWEGEDHCSSAIQLDELAQCDRRNDKEGVIVNGVTGSCHEEEAYQGGTASAGTSY